MIFQDRTEAGRLLAERLVGREASAPVVLALPRGGLPVAVEVARRVGAELDVLAVRKLALPAFPEYAIGAIAEGGEVFLRRDALRELGITDDAVAALAAREAEELARRVRRYRGGRPLASLAGRTVLVVDDGVATGATARAAARAARRAGAARVVLAAPVVAADAEAWLRADFDDVVAVERPTAFLAVGAWYERFEAVTDDEVVALLRRARGEDEERVLAIPLDPAAGRGTLEAVLDLPEGARGVVLVVHGTGSTRRSPRSRLVARALAEAGLGTMRFDLLTREEAEEDEATGRLGFDVGLLTRRVVAATRWLAAVPAAGTLPLAYLGASTGAAAALAAAAALPARVGAVISRGGRPDLVAPAVLEDVQAPVLLVVGSRDEVVLELNRRAAAHLRDAHLAVVPGATHLFEEPGALEAVARLAVEFLDRHLGQRALPAVHA